MEPATKRFRIPTENSQAGFLIRLLDAVKFTMLQLNHLVTGRSKPLSEINFSNLKETFQNETCNLLLKPEDISDDFVKYFKDDEDSSGLHIIITDSESKIPESKLTNDYIKIINVGNEQNWTSNENVIHLITLQEEFASVDVFFQTYIKRFELFAVLLSTQ